MKATVETKFNVGDIVYIADAYYDLYACRKPYVIKDVLININSLRTHISYEIEQSGSRYHIPEEWAFATYEECVKWCEENN